MLGQWAGKPSISRCLDHSAVQNMSSIATHVATEKANVRRVKRYIDALLLDILELN
jgi:hypothetical protein